MTGLYITHRAGTVHGGEDPCYTARQAVLMSRHRQVRLSQVGGWPRAFSESIAEIVFGAIVVVAMLLCAGWRP